MQTFARFDSVLCLVAITCQIEFTVTVVIFDCLCSKMMFLFALSFTGDLTFENLDSLRMLIEQLRGHCKRYYFLRVIQYE